MRFKRQLPDYESIARKGSSKATAYEAEGEVWYEPSPVNSGRIERKKNSSGWGRRKTVNTGREEPSAGITRGQRLALANQQTDRPTARVRTPSNRIGSIVDSTAEKSVAGELVLKRGHTFTYAALFVFTIILYARPAEFYPSAWTASVALIVGVITLAVFVPSQLVLENTFTARPREVNLILLLCLMGVLSIPLAISPGEAWRTFSDTFIRCIVIFVVIINVVRTEARLKGLVLLAILVSIWLSVGAINDYRLGLTTVEGYRVAGWGSGIFGNSNDMALHLVTIVPIVIALIFATRSIALKCVYGVCTTLMVGAVVVSYSRGGFIGLVAVFGLLVWKLGKRRRLSIGLLAAIVVAMFLVLAPGNYGMRVASIFIPSLDPVGSSSMRREILYRSAWTALRHPLLGIGMGNFHNVSLRELVSHNAYTQVAAEMGMIGLVAYTMFIASPFRRLGQIARETFTKKDKSFYYYFSIGLQASLLGYMVCSFFASVAYLWYVYYLVGYAVCLRRLYEAETGTAVILGQQQKSTTQKRSAKISPALAWKNESAS